MARQPGPVQLQRLLALAAIVLVCLLVALLVPKFRAIYLLGALAGILLFSGAFLSPRFGLIVLIFSMLLSPEFGGGGVSGQGQEAVRGFVVRLDDALLVLIGLGWFARTAIYKELGLFRSSPLNRPIAVYLLVCLISTLMGAAFGAVRLKLGFFFVLRYFEYFIVYYMVLNYVTDLKDIQRFVRLSFLVCAIASFIAILQIPSGARVSAPFEGETGEPNTLGGYLVFFSAISLGLALMSQKPKTILKYLAFAAFISIPLLFTLSRASWMAAVPMWIALIFMTPKKKSMLAVAVVLVVIGPAIAPQSVQERAMFIFKQQAQKGQIKVGGLKVDTSTSARLSTWGTALEGWKRAPIFGHGITGFSFMDAQYFRVMAETGLLGLGAFLWLLAVLWKTGLRAYRACRNDEWLGGLAAGYLAGFLALLFHAIGSNTFIILRIMEPFWLYTGLLIVGTEIRERQLAEGRAAPPGGKPAETGAAPSVPGKAGGRGPTGSRPGFPPKRVPVRPHLTRP